MSQVNKEYQCVWCNEMFVPYDEGYCHLQFGLCPDCWMIKQKKLDRLPYMFFWAMGVPLIILFIGFYITSHFDIATAWAGIPAIGWGIGVIIWDTWRDRKFSLKKADEINTCRRNEVAHELYERLRADPDFTIDREDPMVVGATYLYVPGTNNQKKRIADPEIQRFWSEMYPPCPKCGCTMGPDPNHPDMRVCYSDRCGHREWTITKRQAYGATSFGSRGRSHWST